MCNLDQGWPLAYVQVAVTILLFGVGIPSLVLQTIASEDLRGIVRRHSRFLKWGYISIIVVMLITLVSVGIIVHCDTLGLSFLAVFRSIINALRLIFNINQLADVIITLITAGLVGGWSLRYRRDSLLNNLKGKCEKHIRRDGIPDEQVLEDIRYLGEQGKARGEKTRVLEILEQLAYKVQADKHYQGKGLEDIIKAIEFTVQKDADVDSFTRGVLTLKHIVEKMPKSELDSSSDVGLVLRALQRLGAIVFTIDNEQSARKITEAIQFVSRAPDGAFSEAALALSELGVAALENGRFLVAVETLSKLEAMTSRKEPVDAANSSAYLGLIAHFWAREGSARQRALSSLKNVKFTPSRSKCLRGAQESFFRTARFTTADLLSKMIAAL
jgi:hypothetical protein